MKARRKKVAATRGKGPQRPAASSFMEVFDGAKRGGYRGMFFLPFPLDTSRQMVQMTRTAITRKAILGYSNIPELRAVIDGLAIDEVDTALWPKARTSSRAFNRAVTDRFHEENKDPRTFDLRQQDSVYGAQFNIRRTVRLMGDLFGQLIRPFPDFLGRLTPSMSFLPGYQCTSDDADSSDTQLRDGIRFDRETGAPVAYRFRMPDSDYEESVINRAAGSEIRRAVARASDARYRELPASDVLHFHDPFLSDQIRGMSVLAPFAKQMFSMDDIDNAETAGQILRSRVAYAIETIGADQEAVIPRLPGVVDTEVQEHPDGTKTIIQKVRTNDGNEVDVYTPPAGMKLKMVESNRGGALDYRNHLARGMMHCTVYPPEWILFVAGLGQGTVYRGVQNRVQKIANFFRANQLEPQFVSRFYTFWLWKRMQAGVFDFVKGGIPADWWLHKVQYPANMSVDVGRELGRYREMVERGEMAWSDFHALFGRDDEDVDEELVDKAISRHVLLRDKLIEARTTYSFPELEIRFDDIWRPPSGTAAPEPPDPEDFQQQPPPQPASAQQGSSATE